jgi:predicted PurR-regulated permease PerM
MGGEGTKQDLGERSPTRTFASGIGLRVVAGLLVACFAIYALRAVLAPIFFAFLLAYALDPIVDALERRKLPRGGAIGVLLGGVILLVLLFAVLAIPAIVHDIANVLRELPGRLTSLLRRAEPSLTDYGIVVPHSFEEAMQQYQLDAQTLATGAIAPMRTLLTWLAGGTASLFAVIGWLLTVPVFAAYLLYDFDHIVASAGELVPPRHRTYVFGTVKEIDDVVSQFVRGQMSVMAIQAVLYAAGYAVVGVRLAIPIGIIAGLVSFIPYLGGAVAIGLALLMCLFDGASLETVGGAVAVYTVVQVLEGFVITPKIVGDKVGLSAAWVLVALMTGGELFGFAGVLLALPVAAVLKIFVLRGVRAYRASALFGDPSVQAIASAPDVAPDASMEPVDTLRMHAVPEALAPVADASTETPAREAPAREAPAPEPPAREAPTPDVEPSPRATAPEAPASDET